MNPNVKPKASVYLPRSRNIYEPRVGKRASKTNGERNKKTTPALRESRLREEKCLPNYTERKEREALESVLLQ